jgi:hypothetical protein
MWGQRQPSRNETGKFHPRRRLGMAPETRTEHRGYTFSLTSFESTAGVNRNRFNVAVYDDLGCRRTYLRGFSSMSLATAAAKDWIDTLLADGKR